MATHTDYSVLSLVKTYVALELSTSLLAFVLASGRRSRHPVRDNLLELMSLHCPHKQMMKGSKDSKVKGQTRQAKVYHVTCVFYHMTCEEKAARSENLCSPAHDMAS